MASPMEQLDNDDAGKVYSIKGARRMARQANYQDALNGAMAEAGRASSDWNLRFRVALAARGLCLLHKGSVPEATYAEYKDGFPILAPVPFLGPEGWDADHVVVWKDLCHYPPLVAEKPRPAGNPELEALKEKDSLKFPRVVCLCGSSRFKDAFMEAAQRETLDGKVVLMPHIFRDSGDACSAEDKVRLNRLHFRKIDLSDEVLIINVGSYISPNAQRELDYARHIRKRVRFLESQAEPLPKLFYCRICGQRRAASEELCCYECWNKSLEDIRPVKQQTSCEASLTRPGPEGAVVTGRTVQSPPGASAGSLPPKPGPPWPFKCVNCGAMVEPGGADWRWDEQSGSWEHYHSGHGYSGYFGTVPTGDWRKAG